MGLPGVSFHRVPMRKQFTFQMEHDDPLEIEDLGEFYALNDIDPEGADACTIDTLEVGHSAIFGGGAAPYFWIVRVA